ncbi:hypothetical protein OB13_00195 [Pontibacter sp. HJ8]
MKKDLKLDDIPKHNIYEVPEKYFDRLPSQIMERTAARGYTPAPWYSALWKPVRLALVPLVLLLVVGSLYIANLKDQSSQQVIHLATVPDADIVNYLSTYAVLESTDFADFTSISEQELTSEFLNVSPKAAEAELEYYELDTIEY